jgi:uncharacterized membrane protein/thiol-disulfide isomerase/thioredoxin
VSSKLTEKLGDEDNVVCIRAWGTLRAIHTNLGIGGLLRVVKHKLSIGAFPFFRGALAVCCTLLWLAVGYSRPACADKPVVRAVLFYSPSCGHCHQIITQDLPPLIEKYGDQLQIIGLDTANVTGQALYQAAVQRFKIPDARRGVPTLIVADVVLVGSLEIPQQFPGLVETYLAQGGVGWPDIPGLAEAMAMATATPAPTPEATTPGASPTPAPTGAAATATPVPPQAAPTATTGSGGLIIQATPASLGEKISRDLAGNILSIIVLAGMLGVLGYVGVGFRRLARRPVPAWQHWAVPVLSLLGLGVAAYLAYVETKQVAAVCGPVGDCNTVQDSEYALLFGILPVGVFGLMGYVAVLVAWLVGHYGRGRLAQLALAALLAMTLFGTLFSTYLTFLEPFVIGATCAWCLSSAVVMTLLFWLTVAPGAAAISNLVYGDKNVKRSSDASPVPSQ